MRQGKIKMIGVLLGILTLLCACSPDSNQASPLDASVGEGEIFLFEPFMDSLGIYDLDLLQWKPIEVQDDFFQSFGWGNVYPYFVFGQHERKFHAGKIDESILKFNFSLENKEEALAPFATDGELFLYMIEKVTENELVKRVVTISENGELTLIANLDGMGVQSGVIAGDFLYFTSYNFDTGSHAVWRIDLTKGDPEQQPILILDEYPSNRLYEYQGKVLFLDQEDKTLYNDEVTVKLSQKADLIMIDDQAQMLAEKYLTSDMVPELAFTDISSGCILATYENAINFTRTGSVVTIYGNGFIEHLDLSKED